MSSVNRELDIGGVNKFFNRDISVDDVVELVQILGLRVVDQDTNIFSFSFFIVVRSQRIKKLGEIRESKSSCYVSKQSVIIGVPDIKFFYVSQILDRMFNYFFVWKNWDKSSGSEKSVVKIARRRLRNSLRQVNGISVVFNWNENSEFL